MSARPQFAKRSRSTAEQSITLIRIRSDSAEPACYTYAAVRSPEALDLTAAAIAKFGDAETLQWEVLPGCRRLVAREFAGRPARAVCIIGTTEGRAWATWHLPAEPPPVPA
jgi:hypothetical protein